MEQREANGLIGVTFTGQEDERAWVELRADRYISATPTRLYLPVGLSGTSLVEPGDTVWFDPDLPGPNAFSVERGTLLPHETPELEGA